MLIARSLEKSLVSVRMALAAQGPVRLGRIAVAIVAWIPAPTQPVAAAVDLFAPNQKEWATPCARREVAVSSVRIGTIGALIVVYPMQAPNAVNGPSRAGVAEGSLATAPREYLTATKRRCFASSTAATAVRLVVAPLIPDSASAIHPTGMQESYVHQAADAHDRARRARNVKPSLSRRLLS